ncbi:leukocyte receptor cluster member 8 homolog [Uloborus diversus]|uniref:leukocyte receptor cluster member 8 homolog n=1 Tax=Uloborus diversus TaxID=327109 RepID=UPI00240A2036|nr:leukocyte receptor cluster member 8 homolog [Uloborus diversus]
MATWPYPIPGMCKPSLPTTIPEEWQKANEALQAVQQPKTNNSETNTQNSAVSNEFQSGYGAWPNPNMYQTFPGYPPYATNYAYYHYNLNYMMSSNAPVYTTPVAPPNPNLPMPPNSIAETKCEKSKPEEPNTKNISVSSLASQPPPPPPSSPPSSMHNDNSFFKHSYKQAPGSGGIRFSLPKKTPPNKTFPSTEPQSKESTFQGSNKCETNLHPYMLHQNSSSTVDIDRYPISLRQYVDASFSRCKDDKDKDQVQLILRTKLLKAEREGTIYEKDWANEPLPSLHSEKLKKEQKTTPPFKTQVAFRTANSQSPKHYFQHRNNYTYRSRSRSRSRSYSRSRSRSRTPPRKVFRRKRHSSLSDSSDDSRGSKKALNSSVVGPIDFRNVKSSINLNKNKKKKKKNKMVFTLEPDSASDERLQKRAARFDNKNGKSAKSNMIFTATTEMESPKFIIDENGDGVWDSDAIIGTCQDLEKPFLRLTGAVDPTSVRPEEILKKSLAHVKKCWVTNQDYHYACEQLKSIRQDLVVQCIRNSFTIEVYETHARIALEKGDRTEFNQCQSQLKVLYEEIGEGNALEFKGYHILYTIFTESTLEMKNILAELATDEKKDKVVSHALKITKAWSNNNYHRFFRLYLNAPKMSSFIIDWFIERIRKTALKAIIKSFRPNLPVSYIESALAFSSSEDCMAFLNQASIVFASSGVINCKESMVAVANS